MSIKVQDALYHLLFKEYEAEFEVIDGERKHPKGWVFQEWLQHKNLYQSP
jgi:hypothetical protein